MAWAAVRSKAVVLLLLIVTPIVCEILCLVLVYYAVLSVLSSFAIILMGKRNLIALLLLPCDCWRSVALSHGIVD